MYRKNDYTGKRFGRWTVLGVAPNHITSGGYSVAMWDCLCDCGTRRAVRGNDLKRGKSVSCGCSLVINPIAKKHGATGSHLYQIYHGMKARCYNPNNADYKHYGARGIKICDEWQDFETFRKWAMSNGYAEGLTIERRNVNGNYCAENCEWITQREQTRNKRNTVYITAIGERKTLVEWAEYMGVSTAMLRARRKRGWSDDDIVNHALGERCHA